MDPVTVPVLTVAPVDVSDLTTKTLAGTGVLDALLAVQRVHLDAQYNDGRIDNTQYAAVYTATFNQTLQTATAFLLARDKEALELDALDKQNRLLEAQISQANSQRLSIEAQTQLTKAQTASTTMDNAYKEAQTKLVTNQAVQVEIQTKALAFTNEQERLKVEQVALQNQALQNELLKNPITVDLLRAQLTKSSFDNQVAQAQVRLMDSQVAKSKFEVDFQLPQELALLKQQVANQLQQVVLIKAQAALANKQVDKIAFEISYQLPQQLALLTAQVAVQEAEIPIKVQELAIAEKNVLNVQAQTALYAQKLETEKAQLDETLVGAGSKMDAETKLLEAQTKGFKQNALTSAVKLVLDPTMTAISADMPDITLNGTNKLNEATLGAAVTAMFAGVGVTV